MIKLPEQPQVDVEPLYEITQGLEKCYLLFTALEYDVFAHLKGTTKTAEDISSELGTDPKLTAKFLNSLVATGLLTKKDHHYANTPLVATYLVKGEPFYQGNLLNLMRKIRQERWAKLPQVLKDDPIQPEEKSGRVFDKSFTLAMAEGSMRGGLYATINKISQLPEFKKAKRLLDLGGGHGLYAIAFAQINLGLEAFVFDLPPVIEVAKNFIAKYQMEDRVHTIAGDLKKDGWGGDYDIIFASDIFYWPREIFLSILQRVKNALNGEGLFISKQWTIDKERTAPITTVFWDLMVSMLGKSPFYTYTDKEFIDVLKETGFYRTELFDISTASKPSKIIVGRKG